jgi:hypothetical protein
MQSGEPSAGALGDEGRGGSGGVGGVAGTLAGEPSIQITVEQLQYGSS